MRVAAWGRGVCLRGGGGVNQAGHTARLPLGRRHRGTSKTFCPFLKVHSCLVCRGFSAGELQRGYSVTCPLHSLSMRLPCKYSRSCRPFAKVSKFSGPETRKKSQKNLPRPSHPESQKCPKKVESPRKVQKKCVLLVRQEKKSAKINFSGPETAGWGGGLPCKGVGVKKFVLFLESLSSLGFEGGNLGCPGNFAGMCSKIRDAEMTKKKSLRGRVKGGSAGGSKRGSTGDPGLKFYCRPKAQEKQHFGKSHFYCRRFFPGSAVTIISGNYSWDLPDHLQSPNQNPKPRKVSKKSRTHPRRRKSPKSLKIVKINYFLDFFGRSFSGVRGRGSQTPLGSPRLF